MRHLAATVAIEKATKARATEALTALHRLSDHPELYTGFVKNYEPKTEGGETYPPEQKKVQARVPETLAAVERTLSELFDITAEKDHANCLASADVTVHGQTLLTNVPVTYLLFLEKQMNDLRTLVEKLPELDEAESWDLDTNAGFYKTGTISTFRTKKVQKGIVLYDATKEHPAQTQLITDDEVVGYWRQVKHSGAMPRPEKLLVLARIEVLAKAIKASREEANRQDVPAVQPPSTIVFRYLFS